MRPNEGRQRSKRWQGAGENQLPDNQSSMHSPIQSDNASPIPPRNTGIADGQVTTNISDATMHQAQHTDPTQLIPQENLQNDEMNKE